MFNICFSAKRGDAASSQSWKLTPHSLTILPPYVNVLVQVAVQVAVQVKGDDSLPHKAARLGLIQHGEDCRRQGARRLRAQLHGDPGAWTLRLVHEVDVERVLQGALKGWS